MTKKCGFVAILGAPNAGKSTLVNSLVGTKVSIVTHKVQTTRQRILGIFIEGKTQIILMDTPGIFQPKKALERHMVDTAWQASREADLHCVTYDVTKKQSPEEFHQTIKILENFTKVILILNKIDRVKKETLFSFLTFFQSYPQIDKIFMISALSGDGLQDLKDYLQKSLPPGPWLFSEDQLSDLPQRFWASEITREQLFLQLHEELPYETFVETEAWEHFDNGSIKISQVIYVTKEGQKAIILGAKGKKIKSISQKTRQELSRYLGYPVHLFLYVKVITKKDSYKRYERAP